MFKRIERKRKRREEDEELALDETMKEIIGLNDTDSDESDSSSPSDQDLGDITQKDPESEEEGKENTDQEDEAVFGAGKIDEEPPITVAEALKDPLYLISLDPTIHKCILCQGKLIKGVGMAATHKNANAHRRRLEHFKRLAADADVNGNAWELVGAIRFASNLQKSESQELSKRAIKRQAKQAEIREKRKRHRELKAKAIAKKATDKLSANKTSRSVSPANPPNSTAQQLHSENPRKKQKFQQGVKVRVPPTTEGKKSRLHLRTKRSGKLTRTP